jgi:hypothetical protein
MPLERRFTSDLCRVSYEDFRKSEALEPKSLRRFASVGTSPLQSCFTKVSLGGDSGDICSARTSVGSARSSIGSSIELPSRPQGLSVKDWRNIGMGIDLLVLNIYHSRVNFFL